MRHIGRVTGTMTDYTAEALTDWATAVLETVAEGGDLAPLCYYSATPEASYPDSLVMVLSELTLIADTGDVWGSILSTFFQVAHIVESIGYAYSSPVRVFDTPSDWGFSPGASGPSWEDDRIPGEDAWQKLETVALAALNDPNPPFDDWLVEADEASAAIDVASLLATLSGKPLGVFPEPEDESWSNAVLVLLASGWCLSFAADNARRAGLDY